ncbi:MAG: NUDIX domain-containing protein [Parcubacteria group bacterium]|nr:NUDIX domain-containing protein [Parcubacteria group bacterium]
MENKIRNTKSAGGVVLNKEGKVLVVNQKGTSWSLPKGHIDEGETTLEAAKREIYEESGIKKLKFIQELEVYDRYKIGKHGGEDRLELKTIFMFLFKTIQYDLKPIDSDNPEARWVSKEKVSELLTHPKDKEFFQRALEKI